VGDALPPSYAVLVAPNGREKRAHASVLLCRYLILLRVIDVASVLEGRRRHSKVGRWAQGWNPSSNPVRNLYTLMFLTMLILLPHQALASLPDIKSILINARSSLRGVLQPLGQGIDEGSATNVEGITPPYRIMKDLAISMAKTSGCNIVNNILLASLHLSWLLAVSPTFR
jgi:hypothetical protein